MNTNHLKKFAQETRRKLLEQIEAKLEFVLNTDTAGLREKAQQLKKLQEAINKTSREQVIDKVAYIWFNRLMALRFMDANDYQPLGVKIITPKDGYTLPELLDEAKQGHVPDELPVKQQHIYDLLDGKVPSTNPQNEAFKELLIGACNHLNKVFPFLFERIDDFTELLLPDDLISEFSMVQDIRKGMTTEDCHEVEIIGWLYQFYISEKKDEVFASKSKVKKEDIPAATQLFTPRWIVEYMVQNTVGKLWLQNRPQSKLREHMPYFIESPSVESEEFLKVDSVEEITLLDQACGSGHILVYGFEIFSKIYEEEGYNSSEIPQLIIEKNLFGFEIDERAAQLSGLALMMKARSYQRRVFRKELKPNILCYQDLKLTTDEIKETFSEIGVDLTDELLHDFKNMQQATNLGSLIFPHSPTTSLEKVLGKVTTSGSYSNVFLASNLQSITQALTQLIFLSKKYHCVVDNPPYMGGGNMNKELANFVKANYPASKADLMACFMEAGVKILEPKGFLGMINQHSWMFLSSYEKLREKLIKQSFFDTLLHLGPRTFPEIGGEVVQNASFTFWNSKHEEKGRYFRLVDYGSSGLKQAKTLEAIQNPNCGWFYIANQKYFKKIPGSTIGYWVSDQMLKVFENHQLDMFCEPRHGMSTGKNERLLKYWFEVRIDFIGFKFECDNDFLQSRKIYAPYNKGGSRRLWYGNNQFVVHYNQEGREIMKSLNGYRLDSQAFFFKPSITWSSLSSGKIGVRKSANGFVFDAKGQSAFIREDEEDLLNMICALLNSKISSAILEILSPTLDFNSGIIRKIPVYPGTFQTKEIICLVDDSISITRGEWDSRETSWDFLQNELIRINTQDNSTSLSLDLEESLDFYQQYWKNKFFQLHKNEEELNRQFIDIYGLGEELTPTVPLEDITILKEETSIQNSELIFNTVEVFAQFISYAVGCMFGRYSLDKEGLILAKQGETLEDYLNKIFLGKDDISFLPDDDNIIPILDDEWFEDDIAGRFKEFLKASFGKENFDKNLAFVEECLGKNIRKYFLKDFYADHIKRYKKRPIYWMFSSPKGSFNVLVYMHRYTPDTLNQILNGYLKEYREKLNTHMEQLDHIMATGSSTEQTRASKEKDKLKLVLLELQEYERDVLYPIATERITIDLDEGVLVNYNKFGRAIKEVAGLNDKKTKNKVRKFDWINVEEIR
jgi:type II restriction/modification system DNA methylase subunit YeeA